MITGKELKEYSKDRKDMFVIEFENFQKFSKPVKPKGYFVTIAGKYINEDEYKTIEAKKG